MPVLLFMGCFIVAHTVNMEKRVQRNLQVKILNDIQSSTWGCLPFDANDRECGERHWHPLMC